MQIEAYIREKIIELKNKNYKDIADTALSELIGFSSSYLAQIISGKTLPSFKALKKICDFFQITLRDFFNEEVEIINSTEFLSIKLNEKLRPESIAILMQLIDSVDEKDINDLLSVCNRMIESRK